MGDVIEKCILEGGIDPKRLSMVKMVLEEYMEWLDCGMLWKLLYHDDDHKANYLYQVTRDFSVEGVT